MENTKHATDSNDFPVAKALNTVLLSIVALVRKAEEMDLPEDYEIDELNRAYILLVHELDKLYNQNPKLAEIRPEPFWRKFDVLRTVSLQLLNYLDDPVNNKGQAHITRLERLCVIVGNETPELSPEQLKLIKSAFETIIKYRQILDDARLEINEKIEDSWYIHEYRLDYKTNGTILINGVLKLKKTHIDSTIDQLLEQAFKNENVLFSPKLPKTARNLSTVLSSAGFSPELRQLFFPIASNSKGVLFRSKVTFAEASSEGIETTELDLLLKALGAALSFSA